MAQAAPTPRPRPLPHPCAYSTSVDDRRIVPSERARGRHHPLRGEPDPPGARGPCPRRDRDAPPALRPRPLAGAPAGPRGDQRRCPRQAPVPALRGRARDPLAPAHDRQVARARRRMADPAQHLARDRARRTRRRGAQRPSARADDRGPHALRPSSRPARPGHPRARARRARVPAPAARRRSHPPDRRRADRSADHRRHREPVEDRGLLRGGHRPVAAHRRGQRRGGARDRPRHAPADARVRTRRHAGPLPRHLRHRRAAVPALRHRDPVDRAGRGEPDDILVSGMPAMRRIGHKGADLIVPGNTPASFDAALAHGVDMIEFDVLEHEGDLVLAHDYEHVQGAPTLDAGLAHLASSPFDAVELDVDLKLPGYEERALEKLRTYGLVERTLVSTNWMRSLIMLRRLEPMLRLGWSVPRLRTDPTLHPLTRLPAYAGAAYVRVKLPRVVGSHLAAGRCDALMCHWRLVSPRLVRAVREAGGELYVWTVDDGPRIGRLERLGVTGVITNDPRLFAQLPSAQVAAE